MVDNKKKLQNLFYIQKLSNRDPACRGIGYDSICLIYLDYFFLIENNRAYVILTAGSSQVRWNPLSSHTLATAHDGDVKIWDQRKATSPVQYITAHLTKVYSFVIVISDFCEREYLSMQFQIHGLDWCPFQQNQLATSSQDCTVKIFDIVNPRRAESILTTNSPVWRARYTVKKQLQTNFRWITICNASQIKIKFFTAFW